MVDWPGLLKWSLKYQDSPSTQTKDIKPMDEATKKWLEEALKAYSIDHVAKMKEILAALPNSTSPLVLLEDLSDLIENLDAGLILCQLKGMPILLDIILKHPDVKVRLEAAAVFQSVVQNSQENQKYAVEAGGFRLIERVLNEGSIANNEATLSALSAMVRGENLAVKREFIEVDGVEFIKKTLEMFKNSEKIKQKTMFLIKDLVFYDEMLDRKTVIKAEIEANCEKFKGIVKKRLMEINFAGFFEEIFNDSSKNGIETRISAAFALGELVKKYSGEFKGKKESWLTVIKAHLKEILTENQKNDGVFDNELIVFKEIAHGFMDL